MLNLVGAWQRNEDEFSYTLKPRQNGRHLAENVFKLMLMYEKCLILIQIVM